MTHPVEHVLGPDLRAWVHEVSVNLPAGAADCWAVCSEGLASMAHPELVFPLRRTAAATLQPIFEVLGAIAGAAAGGERVLPGGVTRFGGQVLGFDGVFYARPTAIGALAVPEDRLIGLFASSEELDAVDTFGARRLLSLLAQQAGYYPYPPLTDMERERLSLQWQTSVLATLPRVGLPGARVTRTEGKLRMRLSRTMSAPLLRNTLGQSNASLSLLLHEVDRDADACLVWSPGQTQPSAVAKGDVASTMGGCFIAFANEQSFDGSQMVEDGFAYFVRDETWLALRQALLEGHDLDIASTNGTLDLQVRWVDEAATPDLNTPGERVQLAHVQLMNEPAGLDGQALGAYITQLHTTARECLPNMDAGYEVLLHVSLEPTQPGRFEVRARPMPPPAASIDAWIVALDAITPPTIPESLQLQLMFTVRTES